jgi:hypothetical protein
MTVKRILLAASATALMSIPAWALPGLAPANEGKGHSPSTTPNNANNPGSSHRSPEGTENTGGKGNQGNGNQGNGNQGKRNQGKGNQGKPSHPGNSHKCKPHKVAYVASGKLVSQTLTKNTDGSYSGEVTVEVKRTNHHAAGDQGATKTYKPEKVHVTFGLADTNSDGSVGLDDLKPGDRVKLIGKITALAKKCSQSGFKATTTIRQIVFNAP